LTGIALDKGGDGDVVRANRFVRALIVLILKQGKDYHIDIVAVNGRKQVFSLAKTKKKWLRANEWPIYRTKQDGRIGGPPQARISISKNM
jgi:hypothetical protein